MRRTAVSQAIKRFFRTTTLHGFKYLCSDHIVDRIGWAACCCASACCAGVLCVVLWARFLQTPALLSLQDDLFTHFTSERSPAVAVCPRADSVSRSIVDALSPDKNITKRLPVTLHRLLTGRSTAKDQLLLLDDLMSNTNKSLPELMADLTPSCSNMLKRCRYQNIMVQCDQLFEKEMLSWRICCVMRANKLLNVTLGMLTAHQTRQSLELVTQCSSDSIHYGCEFVTMFEGDDWLQPSSLLAGYYHLAQLRFVLIPEDQDDNLVEKICEPDNGYSKTDCMLRCAENNCGCNDPFTHDAKGKSKLSPCPISRLGCLKALGYYNSACHCLAPCKKLSTYLALETNLMDMIEHVFDPFYDDINITSSVVSFRVNLVHSRVFLLNPTETWLTLLSSLGGVFNMFLGVGLFSALEFLYFMIIKLPVACRKSSDLDLTTSITVLN